MQIDYIHISNNQEVIENYFLDQNYILKPTKTNIVPKYFVIIHDEKCITPITMKETKQAAFSLESYKIHALQLKSKSPKQMQLLTFI